MDTRRPWFSTSTTSRSATFGVSGTIIPADIVGPAAQGINPGEPTAFEELVRAIRAGFAYANVHSTRWTGGEIRGQLHESQSHK